MTRKIVFNPNEPEFLASFATKQSGLIEFKIQRHWIIAIALSIFIHLFLLFTGFFKVLPPAPTQNTAPMSVVLAPIAQQKTPIVEQSVREGIPSKPTPTPKKVSPQKKIPPMITTKESTPLIQNLPISPSLVEPYSDTMPSPSLVIPPTPKIPKDTPAITDMQSYVNAAKARRRAAGDAALENEAAIEQQRPPSADEIKSAIIARNLESIAKQSAGQNGLFTILNKDEQYARFSFKGWTNDPSKARNEIFDVDAGTGGNIERAIIKRMIEIIRMHYKEDFNWHSQRMDRVIVLSARVEDTAGLEDFLVRELFGQKSALPVQY